MSEIRGRPREDWPDLSALVRECKVSIGKRAHPLTGGDGPPRTHYWSVLVPPEWPSVPDQGNRPLIDSGSGRAWYDGSGTSERDARAQACRIMGLAIGRYLEEWMSGWTVEEVYSVPSLTTMGR